AQAVPVEPLGPGEVPDAEHDDSRLYRHGCLPSLLTDRIQCFASPLTQRARRCAGGATKMAVGVATTTVMTNELSQAIGRLAANPTRTIVSAHDTTSDMAVAITAGSA